MPRPYFAPFSHNASTTDDDRRRWTDDTSCHRRFTAQLERVNNVNEFKLKVNRTDCF